MPSYSYSNTLVLSAVLFPKQLKRKIVTDIQAVKFFFIENKTHMSVFIQKLKFAFLGAFESIKAVSNHLHHIAVFLAGAKIPFPRND